MFCVRFQQWLPDAATQYLSLKRRVTHSWVSRPIDKIMRYVQMLYERHMLIMYTQVYTHARADKPVRDIPQTHVLTKIFYQDRNDTTHVP